MTSWLSDFPTVPAVLSDLLYLVAVAVPIGIVVAASETPKADRRTMLVMVVSATACIALAWPLATVLSIESGLGLAVLCSAVASLAGYTFSRKIRRMPTSQAPTFIARTVLLAFAAVGGVGLTLIAVEDPDVGVIVSIAALLGIALSALYYRRIRREAVEP